MNESGEAEGDAPAIVEEEFVEGDMSLGTGIWSHDEVKPIKYEKLLERFFTHLHSAHPDLMSSGSKSYVIPPPQVCSCKPLRHWGRIETYMNFVSVFA